MQTTSKLVGTTVYVHCSTGAAGIGVIEAADLTEDADVLLIKNQQNQAVTRVYSNFSNTANLSTYQTGSTALTPLFDIGNTLVVTDANDGNITGSYEVQPGTSVSKAIGDYCKVKYKLTRWL